jgi:hypothetical protein
MGQYHNIVSATANEYLDPHALGCGLKMLEQGLTYAGTRAALIAMISRSPGNQPADLGYSPMIGRWAGHRILGIGDYAEDEDIPGWDGTPLSKIYKLCDTPSDLEYMLREYPQRMLDQWRREPEAERKSRIRKDYSAQMKKWKALTRKHAAFADITEQVIGIIESGCGVRFHMSNSWRTFTQVKALAERDVEGRLRYVLGHTKPPAMSIDMLVTAGGAIEKEVRSNESYVQDPDLINYLARMSGTKEHWWDRAPKDHAHHNFRDDEVDLGQHRVVASLTKRQFINPMKLGEPPTTAAMMRGDPNGSTATAVLLMVMNNESRGGGDCSIEQFPLLGAWHGDHLIATAEHEPNDVFPTTKDVMDSFEDVSEQVSKGMAFAADW